MNRSHRTTVLLVTLLFGAATVWAIPPDRGATEIPYDFFLWDCGDDFLICEMGDWEIRWTLFYFPNGDPKRYVEKNKFYGGIYECSDPENMLPYNPLSYTWTENYVTSQLLIHGTFAFITVPGHGQIFRDVGRIVFDLASFDITHEAGEHEYWNDEFDVVCAYLANN